MIEGMTVQEFLDVLSSKEPVPGGGGASALADALSNALGQIVPNLTIGRKRYALVEGEIEELAERTKGVQGQFTQLTDQNAKVSVPLAKCYSLPSDTEEEKAHKAEATETRLLDISLMPTEIMEKATEMLETMDILADKGNRVAVSDVDMGVQFIRAALLEAMMNVYISTKSMKSGGKTEEINEEAECLIREGTETADRTCQKILRQLRQRLEIAGFYEPADVYLFTPILQNRQQDDSCLQKAPYTGELNPKGKDLEQGSDRAEHNPVKFTV